MPDIEDIEINLFVEGVFQRYGYDFRNYARPSLKRRIRHIQKKLDEENISSLTHRLLSDKNQFLVTLTDLTITTSEMFRDPTFFRALRTQIVPILKTYPNPKLWIAGCSTGEEIYSTAIVLHETGILDSCTIFATDINKLALASAKAGIYSSESINEVMTRYHQSGGTSPFSNYFHASYGAFRVENFLKKNVVFAEHNLTTDADFIKSQVIMCRNVMIYFDRDQQNRVLKLFISSLDRGGFLCLGSKESLEYLDNGKDLAMYDESNKLYQQPRNTLQPRSVTCLRPAFGKRRY